MKPDLSLSKALPIGGAANVASKLMRKPTAPLALAERLIREHKVAVIPSVEFGMTDGCCFRVAFGTLQKATVAEGLGRLVTGLGPILIP